MREKNQNLETVDVKHSLIVNER